MSTLARDFGAEHAAGREAQEREAARHWVAWYGPRFGIAPAGAGEALAAIERARRAGGVGDFAELWRMGLELAGAK